MITFFGPLCHRDTILRGRGPFSNADYTSFIAVDDDMALPPQHVEGERQKKNATTQINPKLLFPGHSQTEAIPCRQQNRAR